jgi:hypothetical protein
MLEERMKTYFVDLKPSKKRIVSRCTKKEIQSVFASSKSFLNVSSGGIAAS